MMRMEMKDGDGGVRDGDDGLRERTKTDIHNKDEKLRSQPVLGMVIIKKFKKASSANEYEDGTVYDPLSGKTYCGTMSLNGKELKLRGFICGINFVGRTSIWTSAE